MKKLELRNSGVKVSQIVQGLWAAGGGYFGDPQDQDTIEAVHACMELGIDSFDTAEIYGRGHSEQVLGEALKDVPRDKVVLISKAWTSNYGKAEMENALDTSMKYMKTDYLDVYFLHYPPTEQSIEEAMTNIMALKAKGKIRAVGVSNFNMEQLEEAEKYGQVDVIQPCYNLLWRYIDRDVLPYCRKNNIGVISYSSLAQGLLTGSMTADTKVTDGRARAALFQPGVYEKCLEVTEFLKPIAAKYNKTVAQLVINWMANTPGMTAPIVGCSTRAETVENAASLGWELSKEDYDAIDKRSKQFTDNMPEYELFFNSNIKGEPKEN